jgi:cyclopropane-fatty-acyl-phospholipid synthase
MSLLGNMLKSTRLRGAARDPSFSAEQTSRQILHKLFRERPLENVNFRFWNGRHWPEEGASTYLATIVLNRPSALREMLLPGSETGVGEAYVQAAFEVEGNIEAAFELADWIMKRTQGWTVKLDLGRLLHQLPDNPTNAAKIRARLEGREHSPDRDREAIDFHYNISNDFYALWLGRQMAYSCAYFRTPEDDLETAQDNKFDHICRKLGLRAGDRFLDIGCGWGGLILHAARHYGVQAEGITISAAQLKLAQRRIEEAGLTGRITVRLQDYRELPDAPAYDAIASVGMVEHVGRKNLPVYFEKMMGTLKPGGLFLNHGIGVGPVGFPGNSGAFIQHHVFPDSELLQIGEMTTLAEQKGWEVRDVENLRLHYARTLREWLGRLEARHDEALRFVNERTWRVWRLYMAGCAHNFQTARLAVYQTLLARINESGESRAPETRCVWY